MSNRQLSLLLKHRRLILAVVAGFALARFVFLDADPGVLKGHGDIGDEGYWSFAARNLVLYGVIVSDEFVQAGAAPLYNAIVWIIYAVAGVSLYTTRLPGAICGVASIVILYKMFGEENETAGLIAAGILAVENQFFIFSRIGHVEVTLGFLLLLAFYLLANRRAPLAAGLTFGAAAAVKYTAVFMTPAFLLFFLLQAVRREFHWRDAIRFTGGFAVVALGIAVMLVRTWPLIGSTFGIQAVYGNALLTRPSRALLDFVMSFFFAHPSTACLLVLLGVYLRRLDVLSLFGPEALDRVRALSRAEVVMLSWLIGYTISLVLLSDMSYRRLVPLAIPLGAVPALLAVRVPVTRSDWRLSPSQVAALCLPAAIIGTVIGKKILQSYVPAGFWIAGLASILGAVGMAVGYLRSGDFIRLWIRRVAWLSLVGLAAASMSSYLPLWILPAMAPSLPATARIAAVVGWGAFMLTFGLLAPRRPGVAVAVVVLLNVWLDVSALAAPDFSVREASRRIALVTGAEDYVTGDLAHQLSFEGHFHPLLWWPFYGLNDRFAARVQPRYFIRADHESDDLVRNPNPRESQLAAIGVSRLEPMFAYGLYPVRGVPRATYTFYRLVYQPPLGAAPQSR